MGRFRLQGSRLCAAAVALLFFVTALGVRSVLMPGTATETAKTSDREQPEVRQLDQFLWAAPRRRLIGPGSSPPTCRARCGRCLPCRPVHVVIQPGVSVPLEYYPEAWRCRCGNQLFMP